MIDHNLTVGGYALWRNPKKTVNFQGVPLFRGLAWAMYDARIHGAPMVVFSADRRDSVLRWFNRRYHTGLHGQQYLFDHQNDPGFYPANSPDETSHCLRADGNRYYGERRGHIPWWKIGIDASDAHAFNDCTHLIHVLRELGYRVIRPYPGTSEAHHFSFMHDPSEHARNRLIHVIRSRKKPRLILPHEVAYATA